MLDFAEIVARLDDLCPSRRAIGLDAAADALNAAPQHGGLPPLIYAGDDHAFFSAIADAASALDDSTRPSFLRAGIDAMIQAVDPHGGYIGPSDRSTASQAPAERVTGRIEDNIGVIVIPNFNEGTAEFIQETAERIGAARGLGLVIDLRGNQGGLVAEVVASADLFLEAGPVMLSEPAAYCLTDEARTFYSRAGDIAYGLPIIVIIDGETASGAESFALALMQRGRAHTLGARSHGAGFQQTLTPVRLENGTVGALRLTSGELLGPTGSRIDGIGVHPDVRVDAVEGRDAPMERAINILREASR
jgi:C-terminal processing protease CtpA/Prc